jgi:transposase
VADHSENEPSRILRASFSLGPPRDRGRDADSGARRWAKRLSWQAVAEVFSTSWATVHRAVETAVQWGLNHRDLSNVTAIGVDEVLFHRGHKYLTVVYQIDAGYKRLLWVGQHRAAKTLLRFFRWLGPEITTQLRFVCSDMWKPYLKVIAYKAGHVLHVLDRYHIVANINKAIDEVRAKEAKRLAADGYEPVLKRSRWPFLKRRENLTFKVAEIALYLQMGGLPEPPATHRFC